MQATSTHSVIVPFVDTALDTCAAFLARLPYRRTICKAYVEHVRAIEAKLNAEDQKVLQAAQKAFPQESAKFNLAKLHKEDDLVDEELVMGFGPLSWGLIDLRKTENIFTQDRWLLVWQNRSKQSKEAKEADMLKILKERVEDPEIITIALPADNPNVAKAKEEEQNTILGLFALNAIFYLKKRASLTLKQHKIKKLLSQKNGGKKIKSVCGKLTMVKEALKGISANERLFLLLHTYIKAYRALMKLRRGPLRELYPEGEHVPPYDLKIRFPQDALAYFQRSWPRIATLLKSLGGMSDKFFRRVDKCYATSQDFTTLLELHRDLDFTEQVKELAGKNKVSLSNSFSAITLSGEITDPTLLQQVETRIKLDVNLEAFDKMQQIFEKIHDLYHQKPVD